MRLTYSPAALKALRRAPAKEMKDLRDKFQKMNAIRVIALTADTVTLSVADYEALISAAEDAEDIATLRVAEAREEAGGKAEARADNLSDELVERSLEGEHSIEIWRDHRGLTSQALAEAAAASRSYLAEIESRRKPGSIQTFERLAAALKVSIDELLLDAD